MKLEIYEPKIEEEKEQVIRLMLKQRRGYISLITVDENGIDIPQGNLIHFYSNGEVWLASSISKKLGFELDSGGRLNVI